jgi:hypothetical protein
MGRWTLTAGLFCDPTLPLRRHDWDDDRCVTILDQCRRVMSEHSKVLVIEFVLPPGDEPFFGKWLDLHMLVMASGARE